MAELTTNVFAGKAWWGPGYGNADQVPADVAELIGDHCWDQPPVRGNVDPGTDVDGGQGDDGAATGTAAPEPAPSADIGGPYQVDGEALRDLARSRGVKVDKRWSEGRLRDEIAKAKPADG